MTLSDPLPQPDPKHRQLFTTLNRSTRNNTDYSNEYRHRTALDVSRIIYNASTTLRLSDEVQNTAAEYYVTAADNDLIAGASHAATAGAAIRAASMNHDTPRPLGHIAVAVDETTKVIRTKLSQLFRIIDINYQPVEPHEYIDFIATELDIDRNHPSIERAYELLEQKQAEDETFFYSKSPIAVAGGAMYGALRYYPIEGLNQDEVADACEVTVVTIRNHYRPLLETYEQ